MGGNLLLLLVACVALSCGSIQDVPVGHLKPFGAHMEPGKVEERSDIPSAKEFWENYVKPSRAVVFRGAAKQSPMFSKWTDEYLTETFGDLDLRVEAKRESGGQLPIGDKGIGRDTIRHFLQHYRDTNRYAVSELPRPMFHDVMIPPCLGCGDFRRHLVEIDFWLSSFNSSSIVHKDAYNAINCLFNGTKQWKLIEYKYEGKIYQAVEEPIGLGGFSKVNADAVDLLKYPLISEVPWTYVDINASDCLFLPKSMYHQVSSIGEKNMAVSILFSRFDGEDAIDLSDCSDGSHVFTPLSDFEVDWEYSGSGMLSMGNTDLKAVRYELVKLAKAEGYLTPRAIASLITEASKEKVTKAIKALLPKGGRSYKNITVEVIENLPKRKLREFAWLKEEVEPSNTYDHEYSLVDQDGIENAVNQLIAKSGSLERQAFVAHYQSQLHGTAKVANDIFDDLGGKEKTSLSQSELNTDKEFVYRKFIAFTRGDRFAEGEDGGEAYHSSRTDSDDSHNSKDDEEKRDEL